MKRLLTAVALVLLIPAVPAKADTTPPPYLLHVGDVFQDQTLHAKFGFGCYSAEVMKQGVLASNYLDFLDQHDPMNSKTGCMEFRSSRNTYDMMWTVIRVQDWEHGRLVCLQPSINFSSDKNFCWWTTPRR
ncbi:hypothetical protein [Bradyrhizobium sp. BR 1432]|uniref:hypothetical protein n=1 Tax=Bradyrhizobium sp. BR 1432 TaxID=3447966 RepID=UPI003EE554B7